MNQRSVNVGKRKAEISYLRKKQDKEERGDEGKDTQESKRRKTTGDYDNNNERARECTQIKEWEMR